MDKVIRSRAALGSQAGTPRSMGRPGRWATGSPPASWIRHWSRTRYTRRHWANGLVADDGERQCWATIRSGLSAGLQEPVNLARNR